MKKIINDSARLLFENDIPKDYLADIYVRNIAQPLAVAKPINEDEVVALVKYANENNIVMIVRGAATGAVGSQVPVIGGELIIDLSLMNKILNFDEETLTLTVEAGASLESVQKAVNEKGYFYAPDPGAKVSTIGGNIATNAGGMRAVKYGTTRDFVRAMTVVLANGEKVELGSLNIKSSAGYDLKNLFIGSEGTLGITTKVKLKVVPKPKFHQSMVIAFDSVLDATDNVLEILKRGFAPTALELFERTAIQYSENFLNTKFNSQKGNAYLQVTLDGNDEAFLNRSINDIAALVKDSAEEIILFKNEEEETHAWRLRDHILYALMNLTQFIMLDEVVPINKFGEMIRYTKELQEKHGITVTNFGHAGDGNIHTIMLRENLDDATWAKKSVEFLDDLYDKVKSLGGLISAEHGVGYTKKDYFLKLTDENLINVMRAVKKSIDPKGLLNPGKVFNL